MNRWNSQLDDITEAYEESFGSLNANHLNWKPDAETWSIAQNIHHVMVLNESYFPILESLKDGTYTLPFTARFNFIVSFFGSALLKYNQPKSRKKINTFPVWEPEEDSIAGDILDTFKTHQNELKRQIEDSADLLEQGVIVSSPANKYVVYKLETAFDIIVAHERRHLEQAKKLVTEGLRN